MSKIKRIKTLGKVELIFKCFFIAYKLFVNVLLGIVFVFNFLKMGRENVFGSCVFIFEVKKIKAKFPKL